MISFDIKNRTLFIVVIFFIGLPFCGQSQRTNYRPKDNKVLFVIGQDMGATGGFPYPNNDGYVNHFEEVPAGFTSYTSINQLEGLTEKVNYGSGDVCAQCYLDNAVYKNSVVVLGLYLVNQLTNITNGSLDANIEKLGNWIIATNRPVFVRIGYEFNSSWAGYNSAEYIAAFQYLTDFWEEMGVDNFNTVWQSDGYGTSTQLQAWYPGDDYVDWLGYSHFDGKGEGIIQLAKKHSKPVMIAEATPKIDLKDVDGATGIKDWFMPFFDYIEQNSGTIQAFCYINCNWEVQSMWTGKGWGDSRIQMNDQVKTFWLNKLSEPQYLKATENLFSELAGETVGIQQAIDNSCFIVKRSLYGLLVQAKTQGMISFQLYNLNGQLLRKGEIKDNSEFFPSASKQQLILKLTSDKTTQVFRF